MSSDGVRSDGDSGRINCGLYVCGQTLILKRHIPNLPCGKKYCNFSTHHAKAPRDLKQLDWCLEYRPSTGITHFDDMRRITFKEQIRTGNQRGAQVLLTDDGLVAKIYDPLFYRFTDTFYDELIDVTAEADRDYIVEANAYSALLSAKVQGRIMPAYHGSWTFTVPLDKDGQQYMREIRMILVEHICGTQMSHIDPDDLTAISKENIMRKVIEAETDLRIAGLEHHDFEPRNIVIASSTQRNSSEMDETEVAALEHPNLRICIIDFAMSCVYNLSGQQPVGTDFHSPLFRWAGATIWCEYGWLPPREEAADWMWSIWGNGGRDRKYVKVERDPEDYANRPVWPQS